MITKISIGQVQGKFGSTKRKDIDEGKGLYSLTLSYNTLFENKKHMRILKTPNLKDSTKAHLLDKSKY